MKKISRKRLKFKADKLFSEKVRSRSRCELRGLDHIECSGQLQCMHIVGRANHRLRWEEDNALCGCSGHHFWYTNNPFFFFELIKKEFPAKYKFINEHKNEMWDKDIEGIVERLEMWR
ncbi:MAG: hypothetical protein AABY22_28600 [Nanoarchaeota archaeon]